MGTDSPQLLVQKFLVAFIHFGISFKQEMIEENARELPRLSQPANFIFLIERSLSISRWHLIASFFSFALFGKHGIAVSQVVPFACQTSAVCHSRPRSHAFS